MRYGRYVAAPRIIGDTSSLQLKRLIYYHCHFIGPRTNAPPPPEKRFETSDINDFQLFVSHNSLYRNDSNVGERNEP